MKLNVVKKEAKRAQNNLNFLILFHPSAEQKAVKVYGKFVLNLYIFTTQKGKSTLFYGMWFLRQYITLLE
jgi:hypothetical protein